MWVAKRVVRASHNIVRRFSYTGISVGWTWGFGGTGNGNSVISSNYISTIGQGHLSDMYAVRAPDLQPN